MIQMPNVIAISTAPCALASPAVEDSIGQTKSWTRWLRRTTTTATAAPTMTTVVASATHSIEPAPTSPRTA